MGATGTGKTSSAYYRFRESQDFYRLPMQTTGFWCDGYDGHKFALIDDFAGRASRIALTQLLQLLDVYTVLVPTKGSFAVWEPSVIVITSNLNPRQWYTYYGREEQYLALARRFAVVYEYAWVDTTVPFPGRSQVVYIHNPILYFQRCCRSDFANIPTDNS